MCNMFFVPLFILFSILNWLDFYLTKKILDNGGRELNPVIRFLGLLPAKIGATVFVGLTGYFIHYVVIIPVTTILAGVCVWNYLQLERTRENND